MSTPNVEHMEPEAICHALMSWAKRFAEKQNQPAERRAGVVGEASASPTEADATSRPVVPTTTRSAGYDAVSDLSPGGGPSSQPGTSFWHRTHPNEARSGEYVLGYDDCVKEHRIGQPAPLPPDAGPTPSRQQLVNVLWDMDTCQALAESHADAAIALFAPLIAERDALAKANTILTGDHAFAKKCGHDWHAKADAAIEERDRLARRVGELEAQTGADFEDARQYRFAMKILKCGNGEVSSTYLGAVQGRDDAEAEVAALRSKLAEAERQLADPRVPHVFQERIDKLEAAREACAKGQTEAQRALESCTRDLLRSQGDHKAVSDALRTVQNERNALKAAPVAVSEATKDLLHRLRAFIDKGGTFEHHSKRAEAGQNITPAFFQAERDLAALSTGSAILMPREQHDALIEAAKHENCPYCAGVPRAGMKKAQEERDAARRELEEREKDCKEAAEAIRALWQDTVPSAPFRTWFATPKMDVATIRQAFDKLHAKNVELADKLAAQRPGGADAPTYAVPEAVRRVLKWNGQNDPLTFAEVLEKGQRALAMLDTITGPLAPPSHAEARAMLVSTPAAVADMRERAAKVADDLGRKLGKVPGGYVADAIRALPLAAKGSDE